MSHNPLISRLPQEASPRRLYLLTYSSVIKAQMEASPQGLNMITHSSVM